jgi:hypothetical protein
VIHYHGGPITPDVCAIEAWRARHALISFAHPAQIELAAGLTQSFCLDNGAFTQWRSGVAVTDWQPYYAWCDEWLTHPKCDFALIPDVIDGDEAANDALVDEWVWNFGARGVPVWHLHESVDRLRQLAAKWPRVALGSSGDFRVPGTRKWWDRIDQGLSAICRSGKPICKLHGLRMLNPEIFKYLPLSSGDSAMVALNIGIDKAWKGTYLPANKRARASVLVGRIENETSAPEWRGIPEHVLRRVA